jgi:hypothetical protein
VDSLRVSGFRFKTKKGLVFVSLKQYLLGNKVFSGDSVFLPLHCKALLFLGFKIDHFQEGFGKKGTRVAEPSRGKLKRAPSLRSRLFYENTI